MLHALLVAALLYGLRADIQPKVEAALKVVELRPVTAPPPAQHVAHKAAPRRSGAAAPPNLHSRATPVVVPPPVIPFVAPPVIVAAQLPGLGDAATAGAATKGPGSGSGGAGTGTGSGSGGTGDGGGGGEIPLRHIRGRISDSDYPRAARELGIGGTVGLRFVVGIDGRVGECTVTRSSGNPELDETTCRLIRERFRYRPTLNAAGRAVPDVVVGEQVWHLIPTPADPPPQP